MGVVRKILGMKQVEPVSTFYSGYGAIEMAESIHLHWRNARIEFDAAEFEAFGHMAMKAYLSWLNHGKPATLPPGEMIWLGSAKLDERPSRLNPAISSDEVRLEVQQWADYVHFHWKWLRLELSFAEFVELAQLMQDSLARLRDEPWYEDSPRRTGTNHRAVPHGRVDGTPANGFWVTREDAHSWIGYESYYLDGEDLAVKQDLEKRRQSDAAPAGIPKRLVWRDVIREGMGREILKLGVPRAVLRIYRRLRGVVTGG